MTLSIAVAGKGGTGKTSISSIIIRHLKARGDGPILAIDADPNANLGESLGLEAERTVGMILDEFQGTKIAIPAGMTKEVYLEYKLNEAITEADGMDLLTMGRGEGPECYCYPNLIVRKMADALAKNYTYLVMDNEAGMEHLSRRTTQDIDELLIVSNHSVKGVRTIARIRQLIAELRLRVKRESVIINMVPDTLAPAVAEELQKQGIEPAAIIPADDDIVRYDLESKPLLELPPTSTAVSAVDELMRSLLTR